MQMPDGLASRGIVPFRGPQHHYRKHHRLLTLLLGRPKLVLKILTALLALLLLILKLRRGRYERRRLEVKSIVQAAGSLCQTAAQFPDRFVGELCRARSRIGPAANIRRQAPRRRHNANHITTLGYPKNTGWFADRFLCP